MNDYDWLIFFTRQTFPLRKNLVSYLLKKSSADIEQNNHLPKFHLP